MVQRADYQISYERAAGVTFVHTQVIRWSSVTARAYRRDLDAAQGLLGEPIYAIVPPDHPRVAKFIRPLGFIPCGAVRNNTGAVVPIYERPLHELPIGPVRRWDPEV